MKGTKKQASGKRKALNQGLLWLSSRDAFWESLKSKKVRKISSSALISGAGNKQLRNWTFRVF